MWSFISNLILKYRVLLLMIIIALTAYMAIRTRDAEMSYDFTGAVPASDEDLIYFREFQEIFGDDGSVMVIGLQDKKIFQQTNFNEFINLSQAIRKVEGITQVLSIAQIPYLEKDTTTKKFIPKAVFPKQISSQKQLDSLIKFAKNQKIYESLLFNPKNDAILMVVGIDKKVLDSPKRQIAVQGIIKLADAFSDQNNIKLHYGGLPFVRTVVMKQVSAELRNLLILSGIATACILFFFFRSVVAMLVPLLVIGIVVIWSVGLVGIFGFKITLLMGLLPPLLVVIGVPNCVYLLNKYHQEFRKYGEKNKALTKVIQKIGIVTFMTNATTAIGFGVFYFMDNRQIQQFGIISFLSVMAAFVLSILLLTIIYSYLPAPNVRHLKHLDRKQLAGFLAFLDKIVFNYRYLIYPIVILLAVVSVIGVYQIRAVSYMVDNVPAASRPKTDLAFFEKNFNGVMPLEIVIDTKKKKGALNLANLRKIDQFEKSLAEIDLIARPLSMVSLVKATKQAYYNQNADFYDLPTNQDKLFILSYLGGQQDSVSAKLLRTMVDSTGQKIRLSLKVADIGSARLDSLIQNIIRPKIKEVFGDTKLEVRITGTTLIFIKGNSYLINSLQSSLVLAVILIALIMAALFGSLRMILISVATNLLPLAMTAGAMGFLGIPLKPSSALVFSIAFGIAVDDSIHYLARYRQELRLHNYVVFDAVKVSLHETGGGMFYTSIVLFFGFIVFTYSNFEGTVVLGALTSATLIFAMFGNLILLPSLLLTFDSGKYGKKQKQLDEHFIDEGFISEADDEEIDLSLLKVAKKENE